jgi:hypothetical protein
MPTKTPPKQALLHQNKWLIWIQSKNFGLNAGAGNLKGE